MYVFLLTLGIFQKGWNSIGGFGKGQPLEIEIRIVHEIFVDLLLLLLAGSDAVTFFTPPDIPCHLGISGSTINSFFDSLRQTFWKTRICKTDLVGHFNILSPTEHNFHHKKSPKNQRFIFFPLFSEVSGPYLSQTYPTTFQHLKCRISFHKNSLELVASDDGVGSI